MRTTPSTPVYQMRRRPCDSPRGLWIGVADCLGAAVRCTVGNPPPNPLELPAALVRNRPASRRPCPRDVAACRRPDAAVLAPGDHGVPARGHHAGHHLVHPAGDQDDHRRRADQADPRGAGPRGRPADGAGCGPLGRGRAAAQHLRAGRHRRRVQPAQPHGPPPADPRGRLPRPRAHWAAAGQDHLGRALAALLHLLGPGLHGPQRDHLRHRGGADVAALAPPLPGRARPGPAAGLRGAAVQPPPAPRLLAGAAGDRRADHRGRGGDGRGPGGQGVRPRERADPPPGDRGQLHP